MSHLLLPAVVCGGAVVCVNAVFLGNLMVLAPLLLNGYAGTKYGIAFPVFLRSSFGRRGAVVAALSRGIVAIGASHFLLLLYRATLCVRAV
jgi:NCS1 family nucleobase:cation symporter-1